MSTLITSDDCNEILKNSLNINDFTLEKFELKSFSSERLGHLGDYLLLTAMYSTTTSTSGELNTLKYFVKSIPQENPYETEFIEDCGLFPKELNMYKVVIGKIKTVVAKQFCPHYYYSKTGLIVFENLCDRGFKMQVNCFLTETHIKSALRTMATMHAASLIYEEQMRLTDKNYILESEATEYFRDFEGDFLEGHARNKWYKTSIKCAAELVEYFTGKSQLKSKIMDYLKTGMPPKVPQSARKVLVHHDLWINNLMFNEIDECLFVDFQLAQYNIPAIDLWSFLYFNVENTYLQNNLNKFIKYYYKTLETELMEHGMEVAKIIPKETFLQSIVDYEKPVLFQVCAGSTYTNIPQEFADTLELDPTIYADFNLGDRAKYVISGLEKSEICRRKLESVILRLVELFS